MNEKLSIEFLKAYKGLLDSIKTIKKDSDNPYYKSKYADLNTIFDEVIDKINEHGFILIQSVEREVLHTQIIHIETGEKIESEFCLFTAKPDMQQLGSAVTYSRRYSLLPMLNIKTEDDDGNVASGKVEPEKRTDYSKLESFEDFDTAIRKAKSEKQLGALWHGWKEKFAKDSDEFKKLSKTSADMKLKFQNPDLTVGVR